MEVVVVGGGGQNVVLMAGKVRAGQVVGVRTRAASLPVTVLERSWQLPALISSSIRPIRIKGPVARPAHFYNVTKQLIETVTRNKR